MIPRFGVLLGLCAAFACAGCATTVGGLKPDQYVRQMRGQGARRTIPAAYQDVYDEVVESWEKRALTMPYTMDVEVSKQKDSIFLDIKDPSWFPFDASNSVAAYLSPSAQPNATDLEIVFCAPIQGKRESRASEKYLVQVIAQAAEARVLKRRKDTDSAAALASVPAATASASAVAAQTAAPPQPLVSSDVDRFDRKAPGRPDDFALIVGVQGYLSLPAADHDERDAQTVRSYVAGLGVPEENIIVLTGPRATRTGIAKYLEEWLPRNATPNSRVYFYYSGHGAPHPKSGSAYLVPWDGDPSFLETSAYPLARLYGSLEKLKAREVVVVLDACFSGAGGRSVIAKGARPLMSVVSLEAPKGKLSLLAAASGDEITGSLDEQGHGLFTYHLLKGLQGAADADNDGHVTLAEIHPYVQKAVQRAARRQNREQTPALHTATPNLRFY